MPRILTEIGVSPFTFFHRRFAMRNVLTLIVALAFATPAPASEREFTKKVLAKKYGMEAGVTLQDGTKVDLSGGHFVVAVAFTENWTQALGKVLYASHLSGGQPGVILLRKDCNSEAERLDILRCKSLAAR